MLPRSLAFALLLPASLLAQESRIQQARQSQIQSNSIRELHENATTGLATTGIESGSDDESFGVQALLKRQEREKSIRAFAEITGFVTNNVALTRRNEISDAFLIATFGLEYRKTLAPGLQFDASVRGGLFRYNKVSALNFVSVDAGAQLTYHAAKLWDVDFSVGYNYTNLINDREGSTFFQNHAIILAAQKSIPLSKAHYFFAGAAAQFGFADPVLEQRDEYSASAGYHLQATRHLETELLYRYAYYVYEEQDRRDHNQTLSLSLRYSFTPWLSIFGSTYAGMNRSNFAVFDYEVGNLGGGVGVNLRF